MKPARRSWDLLDVQVSLDVLRTASVVLVPHECAIAYDGRSWSILPAPAQGWLDEQEDAHERDVQRAGVLSLVPSWQPQVTACRPGPGVCRRRHQHASERRSAPRSVSA